MPGALTWIARGFQYSGWTPTSIVSGGGGAVDEAAEEYAQRNNIPFHLIMAEWDNKGPAAGPIRNREMAEEGQGLIAVWDGVSKGTKNMIDQIRRLSKPAFVVTVSCEYQWQQGIIP